MTAYNVVRFKVKPGQKQKFIDLHKSLPDLDGMKDGALIKTGDRTYCFVGRWSDYESIVEARPQMIGILDSFRSMLEDSGRGPRSDRPCVGPGCRQFSGP